MLLMFFIAALASANAQGCSDAGFCTLPGFAPLGQEKGSFSAELRLSLEASEPGALIVSPQAWFHYSVSEKVKLDLKLPFWLVSDDSLGSLNTISDPILSTTFQVYKTGDLAMFITAGFRFGLNNANASGPAGDLTMDYQSSLGTTDLILGFNAEYKDISASIALQNPVWQYNTNQNVVDKYVTFSGSDSISMEYIRKPDLMLRFEKKWLFKDLGVRLGIMPIFHLGDDYINGTSINGLTTIENSSGVTINIPLGAWYTYKKWLFGLDVGFPVVTRQERPDGLTRKYVVQPRVVYNFSK